MERSIWLLYVYNRHLYPDVSQLVDGVPWEHEAGGSSPLIRTIQAPSTMVSIVGSDPTDVRSNRAEPAIRNLIFYKFYDIIFIESKGRELKQAIKVPPQ